MNAITTPIPDDPDASGLEFMMQILEAEIGIYVDEKDYRGAAVMCQHFLRYHEAYEKVVDEKPQP